MYVGMCLVVFAGMNITVCSGVQESRRGVFLSYCYDIDNSKSN